MDYKKYLKGSEWRKWDLHIHSPASFHWNGGKRFFEMNGQEKNDALKIMFDTIEESDVQVFCIMDYWTFDGYTLFKKYINENSLQLTKTVFPGMELRIEAPVNYRLNIHTILSDQLTNQKLIDFRSKLMIRNIKRSLSDEAIRDFAKTLDDSKAKKHGYNSPERLDDEELIKLGSKTIEITQSSLEDAVRSVKRGECFIIMPYDTSDGLKKLNWQDHPQADNYFMQSAHVFESRDEESIDLFNNKRTEANKSFIDNFIKTMGGKPKPVICGSDAHCFSDYGNFPSNKVTWIKANPTFEGFKQILYEPSERVKIQSHSPEQVTPYQIIDKVRFIDHSNRNIFPTEWIQLNPHLNVIIGGKSSGKSILLYHIAKSIAPEQVTRSYSDIDLKEYDFGDSSIFDFNVVWLDDHKNTLSEEESLKTREITYLPQMYINFLAEIKGKENLKILINSILEQNSDYKTFMAVLDDEINSNIDTISRTVSELLMLRDKHRDLHKTKKEIGDESSIKIEIKRIQEQIYKLRKESGFSKAENEKYENLLRQQDFHEMKVAKYFDLLESYEELNKFLGERKDFTIASTMSYLEEFATNKLTYKYFSRIIEKLNDDISAAFMPSEVTIKNISRSVKDKILNHKEKLEKIINDLTPFKEKIKNRTFLKTLNEELDRQKKRLINSEKISEEIKSIKDKGIRTRDTLIASYSDLFECYKKINCELEKTKYSKIDDEISLNASLDFDIEKFSKAFSNLFDRRGNFGKTFGTFFNDKNDYVFDAKKHLDNISIIFEKLSHLEKLDLRYKTGITANDAFQKLFENCFEVNYSIVYKEDDILNMSPGKKGLVLLQLILHISNATHPILIDQPEDNLDNRTIFNELKRFIKKRKTLRQIIIVTHNANIVVSTDAENVIVCNQSGEQIDSDNLKYKFEYVNGALEHTFNNSQAKGVLYKFGVREHVCDVLEGGKTAFEERELKYGFSKI